MAYCVNDAAAPNNPSQLELRIVIVEMDFTEYYSGI